MISIATMGSGAPTRNSGIPIWRRSDDPRVTGRRQDASSGNHMPFDRGDNQLEIETSIQKPPINAGGFLKIIQPSFA